MSSYVELGKLAALVKARRGKKGLREAAREIGEISASTLSRIEQGKTPDIDTYLKICDWLGISPGQLFKTDNEPREVGVPVTDGMTTPEIVEAHLRADRELSPQTAEALANMVMAAYRAVTAGNLEA